MLILKSADLFANVPDEDLAEIAPYLTPVYLDPGETIIREGDIGDELYIVVSGEVKFERDGVELARKGERTVFGDLAALDPEPRNATVIAVSSTQVMRSRLSVNSCSCIKRCRYSNFTLRRESISRLN